ncbi:LamG domain-containing protein [Verrucomicrobiales bacterium]|nr:LamG domain-containing protein [Verrucomicrobiales bacterium]
MKLATPKNMTSGALVISCNLLLCSLSGAGEVLFIVNGPGEEETTPSDPDLFLQELVEGLGHTVTFLSHRADEETTREAADLADIVYISDSVSSSNLGTELVGHPTPLINGESYIFDDMGWTGTEETEWGQVKEVTDLEIVLPEHPLAAGLTGRFPVFDEVSVISSGIPSEDAQIIATVPEDELMKAGLFVYEKGSKLADGSVAPATNIGIFLFSSNVANIPNDDGIKLFTAAVNYLFTDGSDPDVGVLETISFDLVPDDADQILDIKIRSANTGATKALELSDFALSGENVDQFSLVEPFPSAIAANEEATLKVGFNNERKLGTFTATLTFTTNDPDADDGTVTATLVAKVPNPDGPLAHYRLDESDGTVAADSSTNENSAAYNGNAIIGDPGLKGGSGTSMTVAGGGQLVLDGGLPLENSFTISLWLNPSAADGGLQTIVGQGDGSPTVALLLAGGDLQWFGGGDVVLFGSDTQPIASGTTYHVAMIYDSETGVGTMLVDGLEVASGDVGFIESDGGFFAGSFGDGALPLEGTLDDIQVYDRPLTIDDDLPWLIDNPGVVLNPYQDGDPGPSPVPDLGNINNVARNNTVGFDLPTGSFDVEYSLDLASWAVIATNVSGTYEDTDADRSEKDSGYYRGVLNE